jgi:hypothetical protein
MNNLEAYMLLVQTFEPKVLEALRMLANNPEDFNYLFETSLDLDEALSAEASEAIEHHYGV